jgi:hypothetical protein
MKKSNPHLKELLMDVVDNQIRNDDPPETRQTFNRLISQGISEEDAKNLYRSGCVCRNLGHHEEREGVQQGTIRPQSQKTT